MTGATCVMFMFYGTDGRKKSDEAIKHVTILNSKIFVLFIVIFVYTYSMCDNCQIIVVLTTYLVDEFTVDIGIFKRSIFFHKISNSVMILKLTYLVSNSISSTYLTVIQE